MKPGRPAAGRPAPPSRPPGEVRIIGGQWKRSRLPVPDRPGLRPTPDRVRETLFNWLGQDLSGWRVLDAFAGSGALGFEAASRGAAQVLLLEHDPAVARSLEATRQRLRADTVQVLRADALSWLGRCTPGRFELVLLDPPFAADLAQTALRLALPALAEGGFVYVEAGEALADALPGATLHRSLKAGAVSAQLWRRGT